MASIRKLIPLLDRVLVERIQAVTKTASGILLPESATSKVGNRSDHFGLKYRDTHVIKFLQLAGCTLMS